MPTSPRCDAGATKEVMAHDSADVSVGTCGVEFGTGDIRMAVELRINGATIFCEAVGEGRPCICLHGGPGTDASGLARTLSPLAAELDLRLIFYDHPGHGRSAWVDRKSTRLNFSHAKIAYGVFC